MKLTNTIYILTLMLFICCSNNVIDEDDLIEKASLKYLNNNDEPYTGAISSKFENGKNKIIGQASWSSVVNKTQDLFEIFGTKGSVIFSLNFSDEVAIQKGTYYEE